ncbi:23752_t:CDS:2, partial [Cetraspora pellucida]
MTESHYKELQETLENEREMLIQANPHFSTRTNAINNLVMDPNIYTMLSSWYATATKSLPTFTSNQNVENESKGV